MSLPVGAGEGDRLEGVSEDSGMKESRRRRQFSCGGGEKCCREVPSE